MPPSTLCDLQIHIGFRIVGSLHDVPALLAALMPHIPTLTKLDISIDSKDLAKTEDWVTLSTKDLAALDLFWNLEELAVTMTWGDIAMSDDDFGRITQPMPELRSLKWHRRERVFRFAFGFRRSAPVGARWAEDTLDGRILFILARNCPRLKYSDSRIDIKQKTILDPANLAALSASLFPRMEYFDLGRPDLIRPELGRVGLSGNRILDMLRLISDEDSRRTK